jgi:hypothetical protein
MAAASGHGSLFHLLYGVGAYDAATFSAAELVTSGVAFMASYLPARRALALDPISVLRSDLVEIAGREEAARRHLTSSTPGGLDSPRPGRPPGCRRPGPRQGLRRVMGVRLSSVLTHELTAGHVLGAGNQVLDLRD